MNTLESCYEINFDKINFLERKIRITHPKTILYGPPKCGKSYLIYDYLSNFNNEDYLYIDFSDLRNNYFEIKENLSDFIKTKPIKVLVLENFDFPFTPPLIDSVIISTTCNITLRGFKIQTLKGLDFEEFLLHDNKHQNTLASFNSFFKYGNLPQTISFDDAKKVKYLQEVLRSTLNPVSLEVFKTLVFCIDEKKSLYQLFTLLKNKIKISKDSFYAVCKNFEKNNIFYFLKKYNQEKAPKKIYCYNQGFFSATTHIKKFKQEFTNMIFLELVNKCGNIFYLDYCDFYLEDENIAIFSIPFFNSDHISDIRKRILLLKKEIKINKIYIISIGHTQSFFVDDFKIEVQAFYEWALTQDF